MPPGMFPPFSGQMGNGPMQMMGGIGRNPLQTMAGIARNPMQMMGGMGGMSGNPMQAIGRMSSLRPGMSAGGTGANAVSKRWPRAPVKAVSTGRDSCCRKCRKCSIQAFREQQEAGRYLEA